MFLPFRNPARNPPLQIYTDSQRFRSDHFINEVAPDVPGAISFTSSGRLLSHNQVC